MAEFEIGAKVQYRGMRMPAEILSGPHPSPGRNRYLIRKADGNVSLVSVVDLERAVSRLDRVADTIARTAYNRPFGLLTPMQRIAIKHAASAAITVADQTRGQF